MSKTLDQTEVFPPWDRPKEVTKGPGTGWSQRLSDFYEKHACKSCCGRGRIDDMYGYGHGCPSCGGKGVK